jgi:hypothetical protein
MVMTERRECLFYRNGVTACTRAAPCVPCLVARSRVVERVGLDFPAWGVWVQEAVTANA